MDCFLGDLCLKKKNASRGGLMSELLHLFRGLCSATKRRCVEISYLVVSWGAQMVSPGSQAAAIWLSMEGIGMQI